MTPEGPFSALSFIAGPAILTNACAVMLNGATTRYSLAIMQWREFSASLAAGDHSLGLVYADPGAAVALADRRVRLQLRALGMLNGAVALFAATTVVGLGGAFLVQSEHVSAHPVALAMALCAGTALLLLLASTGIAVLESACGRAMLRLQRNLEE